MNAAVGLGATGVQGVGDPGVAASTMTLRLLGGFELIVNDRRLKVPDGSQKVIAFLALQTAPVRRSFVAGSLWTEKGEDRAAANLRTALWRLPEEGAAVVVGTGTALSLASNVSVDYRDALRATRTVIQATSSLPTQPLPELDALDADFLPGWYDDWIITERERLTQMRLHALEVLARRALAQGYLERAIDLAESIVRAEPLRETGHLILVKAHLASGNRSDALRQVKRLDTLLRAEMGITASAEAWRLVELARP